MLKFYKFYSCFTNFSALVDFPAAKNGNKTLCVLRSSKTFETLLGVFIGHLQGVVKIWDRYDQNLMHIVYKQYTLSPSVRVSNLNRRPTLNSIFNTIFNLNLFPWVTYAFGSHALKFYNFLELCCYFHGIKWISGSLENTIMDCGGRYNFAATANFWICTFFFCGWLHPYVAGQFTDHHSGPSSLPTTPSSPLLWYAVGDALPEFRFCHHQHTAVLDLISSTTPPLLSGSRRGGHRAERVLISEVSSVWH